MTLHRDVLIHAIRNSETPESAADLILEYTRIGERVAARKQQIEKILSDARKQVQELKREVICTHDVVKRNPDPPGGRDIDFSCLICGEPDGGDYNNARFT